MKGRAIIPLVVGLGVGLVAVRYFVNVLQKAKGATTNDTVTVVVANADIGATVEIKASMVESRQVARALAPSMAFSRVEDVVGRVAATAIPKGMSLSPSLLAPKGTPPGMAVRIPDGYRAVAVNIDESAGVAGWVKSGSRVDVVVMLSVRREGRTENVSKMVLQNVEVLAVGQDLGTTTDVSANLAKSVTLLVEPRDVPKLHLAATRGKIRLAMRNQNDVTGQHVDLTTDNDLLSNAPAQTATAGLNLLSRLFAPKPKVEDSQTDKDRQAQAALLAQARAARPEPWSVEVLKGSRKPESVWFEDNRRQARRIEAPEQRPGSPALAVEIPAPVPPSASPSGVRGAPADHAAIESDGGEEAAPAGPE